MIPPIPRLENYGLSPHNGFLPSEPPLQSLPDPYYSKWENIVSNLQGLLLSKRLRGVIDALPTLSTSRLRGEPEWRRAYSLMAFMSHAYIWGGDKPSDRLPSCISIPFIEISDHLQLPPVATYAGVCLWNWKPLFPDEEMDNLENLSTLATFTGSLDESWFYLVSVAIESRGGPIVPLMLKAFSAAWANQSHTVIDCLHSFAERLDELGTLLQRMYENCDPHVFYHRIRPFLAGSKNMAEAGLPNGVLYEDGSGNEVYRQYSGGSNAQSSLIQFFDIALGVEHRPTGSKRVESSESEEGTAPPNKHNFIQDMRKYMPAQHREFLEHVANVANIREYVEAHRSDRALCVAYDACLAMLRAFRDKHIQMVSRYIIVKSRESRSHSRSISPRAAPQPVAMTSRKGLGREDHRPGQKKLKGTGGTALIPFLKQARDETGEPAIDAWARLILSDGPAGESRFAKLGKVGEHADGEMEIVGLAGTWAMDDSEGGLCHW
ncbi:MAG: nicotinamide n-methyltransferase [Chaenotheca gracillima]|nr:MAG: nicotinamide n-methyltransferase [Chaenotheca gracillima]